MYNTETYVLRVYDTEYNRLSAFQESELKMNMPSLIFLTCPIQLALLNLLSSAPDDHHIQRHGYLIRQ